MKTRTSHPPGRHPRRVLAVRVLLARLAWLESPLRWEAGRIVWEGPQGPFSPSASDLSRAQTLLHKIAQYPISADLALGDRIAWLAERQARLDRAKDLRLISAPDLHHLARHARATQGRNPRVVAQLIQLLTAEALCLNALPISPAVTLLACGSNVEPALRTVVDDEEEPQQVRALAALTLGALVRAGNSLHTLQTTHTSIRNAFQWGRQEGLPADPASIGLTMSLMGVNGAGELAQRALVVLRPPSAYCLTIANMRELLGKGLPTETVVELAEAVRKCEAVMKEFLRRNGAFTPADAPRTRRAAQQLQTKRMKAADALALVSKEFFLTTREPQIIDVYLGLLRNLLPLADWSPWLLERLQEALRHGLGLPVELRAAYVRVLDESVVLRLAKDRAKFNKRPDVYVHELANWLRGDYLCVGQLLCQCRHEEIAREAIALDVQSSLKNFRWKEPGYYRLVLAIARQCAPEYRRSVVSQLCSIVERYSTLREAQSAVKPLMNTLNGLPPKILGHVLSVALDVPEWAYWSRQDVRQLFPTLHLIVPPLIRFAREAKDSNETWYCSEAASSLLKEIPACAADWLDWIVGVVLEAERDPQIPLYKASIRGATAIGIALADGNEALFQCVFRALTRRTPVQNLSLLQKGLNLLKQHPGLRATLAHLWPQQPERSEAFLNRFALTSNLGAGALAPLALLTPTREEGDLHQEEWAPLLQLLPDLAEMVRAYQHAQQGLGLSTALPAGVRRALQQQERMAGEARHLQGRLEGDLEPAKRADIEGRLRVLQERMADETRTLTEVRENVTKRLKQVAMEAQFAYAEQQMYACYRARLDRIAGPLPADMRFTDDLLNAVLLSVDIEKNRKLLARLLRAHLSGETDWREQHPANAAFLAGLADHGIDAKRWLAAHPRRYASTSTHGGTIHIRLEHDPLHILQMGNYFDTCLSFGGMNSFSTVANACELNKRVLFARDGTGRVIGRKLIGLSGGGKLVGFRTYTSLSDELANEELRGIVHHYVVRFAERCGVDLADTGEVPRLFAPAWYDDGVVAWGENEKPPTRSHQSHDRNRIQANGVVKEIQWETEDPTTDDGSEERGDRTDRSASTHPAGRGA